MPLDPSTQNTLVTMVVTALVGAVTRYFEKRKMRRKHRKELEASTGEMKTGNP